MDIKRQYFDLIKQGISETYVRNSEKMKSIARLFFECMENGGVVQLFGVRHGEEFVNEMNYRAGGLAPFHAMKLGTLVLKELIDQKDVDSGAIYSDTSVIDKFYDVTQTDDRDLYCFVSFYGDEPLVEQWAKRCKEKGQKIVAVVNEKSYRGHLLDYCDEYLDMNAEEPDIALTVNGVSVGQLSSTITNVCAQMITAELYNCYVEAGKEAPVLLSANIKGADVHNNSLTDPYERRVR